MRASTDAAQAAAAALLRRTHADSSFGDDHAPPGPEQLDWAREPAAGRVFEGCARVALSAPLTRLEPRPERPRPAGLELLGTLLGLSLGVSHVDTGAGGRLVRRRCVPSAGNLHPLEAYVASWGLGELRDGVHHYDALAHALEQRATAAGEAPAQLGLLLGLTLVPWRTSWKYGLRGLRSLLLDLGHACEAVRVAARLVGWSARALAAPGDSGLARLLGLERAPDFDGAALERPGALLWLAPGDGAPPTARGLARWAAGLRFHGRAGPGEAHAGVWPGVDEALLACARPPADGPDAGADLACQAPPASARRIVARRSARAFAPASLTGDDCAALVARLEALPDDLQACLVVSAATGVATGLHAPPRARALAPWCDPRFDWSAPGRVPLLAGEPRAAAQALALDQPLAGQAAALAILLARLDDLDAAPWRYRDRLVAAGQVGQGLYLWAASRGLGACGLGGFHDGRVRRLLGLDGRSWQPLYLVALGQPDAAR